MLVVDVPATLSNLGPGLDVLGLALALRNRFFVEEEGGEAEGREGGPSEDLVLATARRAAEVFGVPLPGGLRVRQEEAIPRERGLGASATARIAGLYAWSFLAGREVSPADATAFLCAEEGHPDNACAALLGGFVACAREAERVHTLRLDPPAGLRVALCIPDRRVTTEAARRVLPAEIPREDAIYNLSRLAFLLSGLFSPPPLETNARARLLAIGAEDRWHQRYRAGLVGPLAEALEAARRAGGACAFLSGSGSTVAALVVEPAIEPAAVGRAMALAFLRAGVGARVVATEPAAEGVRLARTASR